MRLGFLLALGLVCAGCAQKDNVDPDTIGIGPIPDATPASASAQTAVVEADKAELDCLLQQVEIALAQAPDSGKVPFNGLKVCKIAQ